MRIAVLSNIFEELSNRKEVENDLALVGKSVMDALKHYGHDVVFFDANERVFEKLRRSNIDFVFNVCERWNGNSFFEPHVAAMLELLGIPYTGSGPLTLSLCMNKVRVKEILMHHGIPTPNYQLFYSRNKKLDPDLKFPLIVKPVCMDNSIGITNDSVVKNEEELRSKVGYIIRTYSQPALVEEFIDGREFTIGLLGNNKPLILPIIEINFQKYPEGANKILSYESKWHKDSSLYDDCEDVCPADIPKYIEARVKKVALEVYELLDLKDYGRIDIRLSSDGIPYVLEMNPNPGISSEIFSDNSAEISDYNDYLPKAAAAIGVSYKELIYRIFSHALERYGMFEQLQTIKTETPFAEVVEKIA